MAFFLYRDGNEIQRAQGGYEVASRLHKAGYELFSRPLFTDHEVATEERAWRERLNKLRTRDRFDAMQTPAALRLGGFV